MREALHSIQGRCWAVSGPKVTLWPASGSSWAKATLCPAFSRPRSPMAAPGISWEVHIVKCQCAVHSSVDLCQAHISMVFTSWSLPLGKWISEPRVSMVDFFILKSKHWYLFSVVFECWVSDTTVQDWVTALCCLVTAPNGAHISNTDHQVFVRWRSWFSRRGKKITHKLSFSV